MTTRRHPVRPLSKLRITPEVIEAFRAMERARRQCTCKDSNHPYSCPACRRWWRAHHVLHDALGLPPWQFPAFEYPDAVNPYPDGCEAAKHWRRRRNEPPDAFELYEVLAEAAKR